MPEAGEQTTKPPRTWRPMAAWTGALLLALGLVWFVAAVVVLPRILRPRTEASIVAALRDYSEAQFRFKRSKAAGAGQESFADQLPKLRGLLPDEVIAAWGPSGKPYHGYLFRELKTIAGQPVDWLNDFGVCAIPAKYGVASRRSFILTTNGTVFGHDWGKQVEFFEDFPADPLSSPWILGQLEGEG